jgi:general secretion pathway protein D
VLVYRVTQLRFLMVPFVLGLSACQTIIDNASPPVDSWNSTLPPPASSSQSRPDRTNGALLLTNAREGNSTFIEGSGRFVGEPPTGSINRVAEETADGVTLNLVNVPAPQAAKTILGDILSVKYTVDPSIEGKITIQTPKPVARSAVIDLFQAALRANNAAIVNTRGLYRIVPADQAVVGASLRTEGRPDPEQVGSNLQIVQLKYVAPSEIRRVLEPIAARGGIVRTDDTRHIITLSGNRQEIASMMEAIDLFDVDTMKGMSFALVPVKTSQPDVIAADLKTVFGGDHEGPMAGMVQFLPNKRLSSILVISPQPQYLRRAESWIRRLDAQAQGSEKQLFTYAVQNRRAQELVDVLQSMFSGDSSGASTKRNVAPNYQESSVQSASPQSSNGLSSPSSNGLGSTSSGFTSSIGSSSSSGTSFGGGGRRSSASTSPVPSGANIQLGADNGAEASRLKIVADEAKNAILIEATKTDYLRVMRIITNLDVIPNQVLIETTIAEVTLNDDLRFGVSWFLQNKNSTTTFTDQATGAASSIFPGFSYALTAANVAATLNTLNQITDVNVISSPTLTVMDNKPATLQIGDQVPITTQSATSVLTTGAPIVNSVSYKDTGVILSITPRINESGRVLLEIEQEVSTVVPTTSSGIDSPTIRQRKIKTDVVVNNGEALVLGGMIQDSKTVTRNQVPILGDIPILGNAVNSKDNTIIKTELIILIRPHVIRDLNEARSITDEYRRHLAIEGPYQRQRRRNPEQAIRRIID